MISFNRASEHWSWLSDHHSFIAIHAKLSCLTLLTSNKFSRSKLNHLKHAKLSAWIETLIITILILTINSYFRSNREQEQSGELISYYWIFIKKSPESQWLKCKDFKLSLHFLIWKQKHNFILILFYNFLSKQTGEFKNSFNKLSRT